MKFLARITCILALVALAAGAIANSAGSAVMASAMVAAGAGMADMNDCDACGDTESGLGGLACDFVCNAPGIAAVQAPLADSVPAIAPDAHASLPERTAHGIAGPPAKQPPRTLI